MQRQATKHALKFQCADQYLRSERCGGGRNLRAERRQRGSHMRIMLARQPLQLAVISNS